MPYFSILIPAYNDAVSLNRALESVLEQTFTDFEVIISDDFSPTDIFAILRKSDQLRDSRIRTFRQNHNLGVLENQMFTLDQAVGEYCVFLQHDDWFIDRSLLREVNEYSKSGRPPLLIGNALLESEHPYPMFIPSNFPDVFQESSSETWSLVPGSIVAKYLCPPVGRRCMSVSWSSVFFNREMLMSKNGFTYKYLTQKHLESKIDAYTSEENMVAFWNLLEEGNIFVNPSPISYRGRPETAFSNSPSHPGKGRKNDIEFFNLYFGSKLLKYRWLKRIFIKRCVTLGLVKINPFIIRHLGVSKLTSRVLLMVYFYKVQTWVISWTKRIHNSVYWKKSPKAIVQRIFSGPTNS